MGFVGQPQIRVEKDAVAEQLKSALFELDPDSLSPRQAQEELYRLLSILEGEK